MTSTAERDRQPPRRPARSRRRVTAGVGMVLLVAAMVAACAAPWEQRGTARSQPSQDGQGGARTLQGPSGLRLLVPSNPVPFVLDVDTGNIQPVAGLPTGRDRWARVESVGEDAVVVSRRDCQGSACDADSVVYLVRRGSTVATPLGAAVDVESAGDDRSVWLLSRPDGQNTTHCALSQ